VVLLLTLACPAFATESIFIPSNGMEVLRAEMETEDVKECVVVTSVPMAKDQSTDIMQEARDFLIEVYDALSDGSMELPVEGEFRYIELADVSFAENACIQDEDHENEDHKTKHEILHETNAALTVEFKLEIIPEGEVLVLAYVDEEWKFVENVTDQGDGKIVVVFDEICPVVFIEQEGNGGSEDPTEVVTTEPLDYPIASANFVPSITYKDGIPVVDIESNIEIGGGNSWGSGIDECVVVTSIAEAIEKSTDISQDDRDLLLEVYEALAKGEMELPLEGDYVIRDLVDISFEYDDCRCIEEHGHKDQCLAADGVTLTITFDMDVTSLADVVVMAYVNGEWTAIKSVTNNGDGTVTCIFEDICPVAFVVNENTSVDAPQTGDTTMSPWVWLAVMAACVAGIVILLAMKRKKAV
jgi:LPXTG-motif cell wall-anchored protein